MNNENKTVIVTGSSGYLGQAICKRFLDLNYIVIGLDINQSEFKNSKNFTYIKTNN